MIQVRSTIEYSRCDSCGGPSDNPDVAEVVTLAVGLDRYSAQVIRLCHSCIENELLPAAAPWAVPHA